MTPLSVCEGSGLAKEEKVVVGKSIRRIDAVSKVTGEAPYPGDFNMDGQLYMKLRFSDRAHARIVAIDTSEAEALPGVVAIFTAKDVPVNEYGLVTKDQPVLCGPGSDKPGADIVRCYMDNLAIVVAETEAIAAQAARTAGQSGAATRRGFRLWLQKRRLQLRLPGAKLGNR